jgi:hypothetical protein
MISPGDFDCKVLTASLPHQIDRTAAKASAGHARAVDAFYREGGIHQVIELFAAHFIQMLQAAMGFNQQPSHGRGMPARAAAENCFCSFSLITWRAR